MRAGTERLDRYRQTLAGGSESGPTSHGRTRLDANESVYRFANRQVKENAYIA